MLDPQLSEALGPALCRALDDKGYTQLTAVQTAVLDPALSGRDLRITSQTGSGKTLAVGFVLRALASDPCDAQAGVARPRALVVAPTRELAQQVEAELRWLYAHEKGRIASVTGGASYRDERRALGKGPCVIVGTPGRLLDHLRRGAIDASQVATVVLDEADRMLELGFREDIDAIFATVPAGRGTHLVSATFPKAVRALADSVQRKAAHVEGTRLGTANADIDHVMYLVDPRQKLDALINLLLRYPDDQTLIFARMRTEVADIASSLSAAGFAVTALSGEMDQAARNRALAGFKRGALRVLVATEVAARGIDVQDIARVVHAELPANPDAYTHRAGRTGRAGRKGVSALLVVPAAVVHATRLLRSAGVAHRFEPIPTAEEIRKARDERIVTELAAAPTEQQAALEAPLLALAERLLSAGEPARTMARLLARSAYASLAEARELRPMAPSPAKKRGAQAFEREPSQAPAPRARLRGQDRGFVTFRVSWGEQHGADARRLLALVCRRGEIAGKDVGAIRVERTFSLVDVAQDVAEGFGRAASRPDPRDPRVLIRRDVRPQAAGSLSPAPAPAHEKPKRKGKPFSRRT